MKVNIAKTAFDWQSDIKKGLKVKVMPKPTVIKTSSLVILSRIECSLMFSIYSNANN
jgi:hypothetical protein